MLKPLSRERPVRRTYHCEVCHVVFSSSRTMSRHMEYYRDPKYPCGECGTKFADTRQLEFHSTYTHGEVKNLAMYKLQCPVCNQMAGTKTFIQSHIYHYHNEWAVKNEDTFDLKLGLPSTDNSTGIAVRRSKTANAESKITKSPRNESILKHTKDINLVSIGVTPPESANSKEGRNTSTPSLFTMEDIIGVPFVKTDGIPIQFETLLNGIKIEIPDEDTGDSERYDSDIILNGPNENDRDETLRQLYSCKECYVPLQRIRVVRSTSVTDVLPEDIEKRKPLKEITKSTTPDEMEKEKPPEEMEKIKPPKKIEKKKSPEKIEQKKSLEKIELKKSPEAIEQIKPPDEINKVPRTKDYSIEFQAASLDELCLDECLIKTEPEEFVESAAEPLEVPDTSASVLSPQTAVSKSKKSQTIVRIASRICDKYFSSKRAMQRHFRQRHMIVAEDVVYCVCGQMLPGRREKEGHFYEHCGRLVTTTIADTMHSAFISCRLLQKKHECAKCGEKFWMETCLNDHERRCRLVKTGDSVRLALTMELHCRYRQMSRSSATHVCTECNTGFNSSSTLWVHKQKYGGSESHQCPICKTMFSSRRLLKGHIQSTHEPSRKKLYSVFCEICNQGFTKNLYKRIHTMHCHSIEVERSIRGTEVTAVGSLPADPPKIDPPVDQPTTVLQARPKNSVSPTPTNPDNKCGVCGIEFVSRKRFIDHMIYYKKNEIVCCGICGKDFRGQYVAHHHNKKFHYSRDMLNSYTHRCTFCQDGFMYRTHLKAHVSHVHGNVLRNPTLLFGDDRTGLVQNWKPEVFSSITGAKHSCPTCEIVFPTAAALVKHRMEYSNDGDFACNQCPRKCGTAAMLLDHIALNHCEDAEANCGVECSRCNENLVGRNAWVSHVKHFHNPDGNEPSEFCFESNLTSAREFGSVEIELIPMNDSISSGMAYANFGSLVDLTGEIVKPAKVCGPWHGHGQPATTSGLMVKTFGATPSTSGMTEVGKPVEKTLTNCATCGLLCSGTAELDDHIGLYSNTGRYNCIICDRRFVWRRFFEDHKKKHFHHSSRDVNFCPTCGEGFETIAEMKMHEAHLHRARSNESNESRAVDAKRSPTDGKDQSQTGRLEDNLSFTFECIPCGKKYPTVDELYAHLKSDQHNAQEVSSSNADGPAHCTICETVFVNKKLLMIHEKKVHPSVAAEPLLAKPGPTAGDRFYVLAGVEVPSRAVEVVQKNFDRCYKNLSGTDCIYRYGSSYKCDICGIVVTSKDSLNVHQAKTHTVSSVAPIGSESTVERSSTGIRVPEETLPSTSGLADVKVWSSQKVTNGPTRKIAESVFTKSILRSVSMISNTRVTHYRCKVCDLIFVNKNLLRVHKVNGNCVRGSMGRINGDRRVEKKTIVANELRTLTNSPTVKPETAPVGPSVGQNPSLLANRMSFVNLPPGSYRLAKLKVRPFGKIVQNLIKQTGRKRKNEIDKIASPQAAKRAKKVFDPVAYRELCRQHNLIPAGEVPNPKSAKKPLREI